MMRVSLRPGLSSEELMPAFDQNVVSLTLEMTDPSALLKMAKVPLVSSTMWIRSDRPVAVRRGQRKADEVLDVREGVAGEVHANVGRHGTVFKSFQTQDRAAVGFAGSPCQQGDSCPSGKALRGEHLPSSQIKGPEGSRCSRWTRSNGTIGEKMSLKKGATETAYRGGR
jgi:hypothetical protein